MLAALLLNVMMADVDGVFPLEAPPRYAAYWLTEQGASTEYRILLITRSSLGDLAAAMKFADVRLDRSPPLLDQPALVISTYQKDSIWNADLQPIKPLTQFRTVSPAEHTVEVNRKAYRYEECPLADAVRLLKAPEGRIPIHRLHAPLTGMTQTAHALQLLLEEQIKKDAHSPERERGRP